MELRVLQYFLAVTREQNILRAAESLNLSQPTLSRQIRDMEAELGKQLFIRGSRSITLTEEGMILRKRAEEIMELVKKAEDEIALAEEPVSGSITVGAGETDGLRVLVRAVQALREEWPGVHFHVVSGDKCSVIEQLDGGLMTSGWYLGISTRPNTSISRCLVWSISGCSCAKTTLWQRGRASTQRSCGTNH